MTWLPAARLGSKLRQALVWRRRSELLENKKYFGGGHYYLGADEKRKPRLIVVLARGDDIPFLTYTPIARLNLHRGKVLPEVP